MIRYCHTAGIYVLLYGYRTVEGIMMIPFKNSYIELGDEFYTKIKPTPVANPRLIQFNDTLAKELGIDAAGLTSPEGVDILAGNTIATGSEPLAMVYAGHQFGSYNPQLGDGRAILLGEIVTPDGCEYSIQLKGSGQTPYSRNGDGRAALGPVLREYLVSEAMAKLGIPTTRALAAVSTGEEVARMQLLPGAIITRVAASFIRIGTFQYFANNQNDATVKQLADYVIQHYYPEVLAQGDVYQHLLLNIIDRQAKLIAQWMHVGFIHGVMNTDNMAISGETIDYGPCAFMDDFSLNRVYSSIDRQGRYAYNQQASIAYWNLARLAETLLPLLDSDEEKAVKIAENALATYPVKYKAYWLSGMRQKLGLSTEQAEDAELATTLFELMDASKADFTLTFYYLSRLTQLPSSVDDAIHALFDDSVAFTHWLTEWRKRLKKESQSDKQRHAAMQVINPVYIPRNHQIEAVIRAAEDYSDFAPFHALHQVLQTPFTEQEAYKHYKQPPQPDEVVQQTFCGT